MKAIKILFSLFILIAALSLLSCGKSGNEGTAETNGEQESSNGNTATSPAAVCISALNNIADENFDDVVELYVKKNGDELTDEDKAKIKAFLPNAKNNFDKNGGMKEVLIVDETVSADGNSATVKYKVVFENGKKGKTEKMKLLNVNGNWRVRTN